MSTEEEILRRIGLITRKRAAITGSSFDFIQMPISCPQCKKEGLQPLAELEVNDDADCPYCSGLIDLRSPDLRTKIRAMAQVHKQIKPM